MKIMGEKNRMKTEGGRMKTGRGRMREVERRLREVDGRHPGGVTHRYFRGPHLLTTLTNLTLSPYLSLNLERSILFSVTFYIFI